MGQAESQEQGNGPTASDDDPAGPTPAGTGPDGRDPDARRPLTDAMTWGERQHLWQRVYKKERDRFERERDEARAEVARLRRALWRIDALPDLHPADWPTVGRRAVSQAMQALVEPHPSSDGQSANTNVGPEGAKALDDEPGSGDRMSASQREELWVCTRLSGEHAITTNAEVAEAWERAGWRKDGPWVRAEHHVPAEQLQVALAILNEAMGDIASVNWPDDVRTYIARAALALGESQEEM